MIKTSVFMGASVDGFIARLDGALDFLDAEGSEPHGFEAFMASVDAIVMGRNTYDIVLAFPAWPYADKPVFVLSSRSLPRPPAGVVVEQMSGEPAGIVRALAARGVQHLYIDGGITVQRFLNAGLIQRLTVTRVPVLIGTGIPIFGPTTHDIMLRHIATRSFAGGLVQTEYEV